MSVKIRLSRIGKLPKKRLCFRIVAIDTRKARDGVFIEQLGIYGPAKNPPIFKIDKERLEYWKNKGAVLSDTVASLVKFTTKTGGFNSHE